MGACWPTSVNGLPPLAAKAFVDENACEYKRLRRPAPFADELKHGMGMGMARLASSVVLESGRPAFHAPGDEVGRNAIQEFLPNGISKLYTLQSDLRRENLGTALGMGAIYPSLSANPPHAKM